MIIEWETLVKICGMDNISYECVTSSTQKAFDPLTDLSPKISQF